MKGTWRYLFLFCALQSCSSTLTAAEPASQGATELRGLWVDAFHIGIRSRLEADQLITDAVRNNFNTLFIQIRRRGDSLYSKSLEPMLNDPACEPGFDPLGYVVDAAHRAGLEVHAWVNARALWRDEPAHPDPNHVFNRHGLTASGDQNWLTYLSTGSPKFPVGYSDRLGRAAPFLEDIPRDGRRPPGLPGLARLDERRNPRSGRSDELRERNQSNREELV